MACGRDDTSPASGSTNSVHLMGEQKEMMALRRKRGGNVAEVLHGEPHADAPPVLSCRNIMKSVLAFLLVGSYLLLFLDWRARRATGPPAGPPPESAELATT